MTFEHFSRRARELYAEIPPEFLKDVTGLVVHRERLSHPHLPEYWTLGQCEAATPLEDAIEFRSTVHLYFGSFRELARGEPDFDWEGELWETLTHEVQHHLEDRAGVLALRDMDHAEEQDMARRSGRRFDPIFYRSGEELAPREFLVGRDLFLEVDVSSRDLCRIGAGPLHVRFGGEELEVPLPERRDGVQFVEIEGGWQDELGAEGELWVALRFLKGLPYPGRRG
jgi:hypothetical protein